MHRSRSDSIVPTKNNADPGNLVLPVKAEEQYMEEDSSKARS